MKLQFLFLLLLAVPALLRLVSGGTAHPAPAAEPPAPTHQAAPAEPAKGNPPAAPKRADDTSSSSPSRPADAENDRANRR